MRNSEAKSPRIGGFGAGVLIGLMIVTPVFAATTSWQVQDWTSYLLYGSLALFVAAVLLRVLERSDTPRRAAHVPVPLPAEPQYSLAAYRVS